MLWWHTIVATFGLALRNDAHTHILLIIPVSIALIVSEWRSQNVQPEPKFRSGLVLLVLAILIDFIGSRWRGPAAYFPDVRLSSVLLAVAGPAS